MWRSDIDLRASSRLADAARGWTHRQRRGIRPTLEVLEKRTMLAAVPVGPEFQVNTTTASWQSAGGLAMDAEGNFVVAWSGYSVTQNAQAEIYARRYNAAGVPQGGEIRVNTFRTGWQMQADVAMDADGDFVVVWASKDQDGSGYGVYGQRYNAAGAPQGAEFRANTYTTNSQWYPSVAMDDAGNFVVAWQSEWSVFAPGQDGSSTGVYAQRFNAAGVKQGGEFRVNTFTTDSQGRASVAMDADGDFVITWQSNYQDGWFWGIFAQRYNAAGVKQGNEFQVNTYTVHDQLNPDVAMGAGGEFVIAWGSRTQEGPDFGVFAQRYDADGAPQGDEFQVNAYTTGDQARAAVAIDADGNFIIAWSGAGASDSSGVYAQRYDAAGRTDGADFRINTYTPNGQDGAVLALDAEGNFTVAWSSFDQDGSDWGAFAQRFAIAPAVVASEFHFAAAPHELRFGFDRNVSPSLASDDLVVENRTTGQILPSADFSVSYDAATNQVTFAYTAGALPDGSYRATLLSTGITTPQGAPLASDHVFDFFFLRGDANHDGLVNLADFNILAANFGQSGPHIDFTKGDFNYDGTVNLADFNILAGRFGQVLAGAPNQALSVVRPLADQEPAHSKRLTELE